MRYLIVISILLLISYLSYIYLSKGIFNLLWPGSKTRLVLKTGIITIFMTMPAMIIFRRLNIDNMLIDIISFTSYTGIGLISFMLTILVIRDIIRLFLFCIKKLHSTISIYISSKKLDNTLPDFDRRIFLSNSFNTGVIAASCMCSGYGFFEAKKTPNVKKVSIPITNLGKDFEGFKIVQITDIHLGPTLKKEFLNDVVQVVNSLDCDICVLTGDLVDGKVPNYANDVLALKNIKSVYGNFFVTGNHEYYFGALEWIEKVKSLGFTVLLNENHIITKNSSRICLAGVTDYRAGGFIQSHKSDPFKSIKGSLPSDTKILLAHQPKSISDAAKAKFDLQISGHTHGGQFFPWNFFVKIDQPFVSGLHKVDNTQLYISRGTGYWGPPVRLGSPSEITLITLTKSQKQVYEYS